MAKISNLKKKLDNIFSQFVRLRDSDEYGYVYCCSCQTRYFWRDVDAGHYIRRGLNLLRYNEVNVNAQCRSCNRGGNRNTFYTLFLTKKYGNDIIEELSKLEQQTKQWKEWELQDLIKQYTQKVEQLKKEKNL